MSAQVQSQIEAQPALFTLEELAATAELERELDRALCRQYLDAWLAQGMGTNVEADGITFEDFRAAGDRLAAAAA